MITVWKYELQKGTHRTELDLPKNAKVLKFATQKSMTGDETMCLWIEVDTKQKEFSTESFEIVGTGHPVPVANPGTHMKEPLYIGTVLVSDDQYEFHLYYTGPVVFRTKETEETQVRPSAT